MANLNAAPGARQATGADIMREARGPINTKFEGGRGIRPGAAPGARTAQAPAAPRQVTEGNQRGGFLASIKKWLISRKQEKIENARKAAQAEITRAAGAAKAAVTGAAAKVKGFYDRAKEATTTVERHSFREAEERENEKEADKKKVEKTLAEMKAKHAKEQQQKQQAKQPQPTKPPKPGKPQAPQQKPAQPSQPQKPPKPQKEIALKEGDYEEVKPEAKKKATPPPTPKKPQAQPPKPPTQAKKPQPQLQAPPKPKTAKAPMPGAKQPTQPKALLRGKKGGQYYLSKGKKKVYVG